MGQWHHQQRAVGPSRLSDPLNSSRTIPNDQPERYKTKGATNELFDEAYASSTSSLSVALHRFLAVYVRRAVSADRRESRAEYCSGSRRLGRWFWLERRLRLSCQGWLQGQHRARAGDVLSGRCDCREAYPRTARRTMHPCRAQLWGSRNYGSGNDLSIVGLVYIAAHMPDSGEKESDDGKRFPSDLARSGAIKKTPDGFTYIDPAQFHELFAADLPGDKAAFMARSQVLNFADNFSATITTAAWRTKPSWMLVAGSDRTSTRIWSVGMPSELIVTQSKSRAQATQSTSRIPRKLQM
jgi:hypothetical protein